MNPHASPPTSPSAAVQTMWRHRHLLLQLSWREIRQRYRASALGVLWSLLTPLFMLGVYTLVFSGIFNARWGGVADTQGLFAVVLFVGISLHGLMAEITTRAPGLIAEHTSYVKKVMFPLEVLPAVPLLAGLFQCFLNLCVLVAVLLLLGGGLSWHVLQLPLVLAPFVLLLLGLAWLLSAMGVFLRDLSSITTLASAGLMFLAPVFYPMEAAPAYLQPWLQLNPLTFVIEQARRCLIWAQPLQWAGLAAYTAISALVAWLGFYFFQKTRKGFADVL
jgi:lipopolysaccharide transport system permease protein